MKNIRSFWLALGLGLALWFTGANSASAAERDNSSSIAENASRNLSMITGVAISPLLGISCVGAYQYYHTPEADRAHLHWYARPMFWGFGLFLAGIIGLKDILGTAAPTVLKKPFDVAETLEHKVSALIAAGAFVPFVISVFPSEGATQAHSLSEMGFAAITAGSIGNAMLVPFALIIFAVVWLSSHAIQILILISPFTTVDTALKAFRLSILSLVTATSFANPYFGAAVSLIIVIICYFISGWSLRLTVFGSVYIWDVLTFARTRFQPAANANWMFTARAYQGAPIRSYGKLVRGADGKFVFEYRPWLFLKTRTLTLPAEGTYIVGRGLFYPEIARAEGEQTTSIFSLAPRFRTHEEATAKVYGFGPVRDVGLLKGMKAMWAWLSSLFGRKPEPQPA